MNGQVRSAEFVFPGHPDKLADAVADAIVQEASRRESRALAGVEVAVHRDVVFVTGRVACRGADQMDVSSLVRDVYATAGYGGRWSPDPHELRVEADLCLGRLEEGEGESRVVADDQSVCVGHAVAIPGTNYLPVEQWLANRLGRRLAMLRTDRPELQLGPDGKVMVRVRYGDPGQRNGTGDGPHTAGAWLVDGLSCSFQQHGGADVIALHRSVRQVVGHELTRLARQVPGLAATVPDAICVNGAGAFDLGGPLGDNGLSGKKLVVDAYGPAAPIGGGALSGTDFFKVDRAGALHARRIAKALVMSGVARVATVAVEWVPGMTDARILSLDTGGEQQVDAAAWGSLFDLSLEASGEGWSNTADLVDVARFGHFTSADLAWERIQISTAVPRRSARERPAEFNNVLGVR